MEVLIDLDDLECKLISLNVQGINPGGYFRNFCH